MNRRDFYRLRPWMRLVAVSAVGFVAIVLFTQGQFVIGGFAAAVAALVAWLLAA